MTRVGECGIITCMGIGVEPRNCPHCGHQSPRFGCYCPHCGIGLAGAVSYSPGAIPAYRRRARKAIGLVRCGLFHHELFAGVFGYRFCPECGERLGMATFQPQPG